ncbi:MAG: proton-conducting transporter membrane subunit, partial [Anaerolineaceae bacterium]|nr:proton-conducting transporter membrane subunit [Anaerolineaceae bacterium]
AQNNIKRLLAYSSIAHSGYLLMAFVPYGQGQVLSDSIAAMLFYLVAYSLATLGAWAVVITLEQSEGRGLTINSYAGLARRHPLMALSMAVFMLSFTGVPLTLGFWGKLYLFRTAIEGGFTGLAVIGLLASIVSAYYYLRVIVVMYFQPGEPEASPDRWVSLTAAATALGVVLISFVPGVLLNLALQAVMRM